MKPEEALEMIKNDMRLHHDSLSGNYRKALNLAIEALEKEIAKTVKMHPDEIGYFICPKCNRCFEFGLGKHRCEHCGQKIKFPVSVFDGIELVNNDSRVMGWEGDDEA